MEQEDMDQTEPDSTVDQVDKHKQIGHTKTALFLGF